MSGSKLGWNHPVCLICRYFMSGSQLWIESPCMFKLSVLHVWLKTFGWNHPVCLICQYFMSGSKLLDGFTVCSICQYFMSGSKHLDRITLYVQLGSTLCLIQNFWMESPCIFNLSVHVWFKTWMETPCKFSLSVLHVWFKTFGLNYPVCSICKYFLSGSKLLD